MIIIGLADIHGNTKQVSRLSPVLEQADLVLLVGDITHFGKVPEIGRIIEIFGQFPGKLRAVSGNCDYRVIDNYLDDKNINLHGRGEPINGIGFIGVGGSLITPFGTPNEYEEIQLDSFLEKGKAELPDDIPLILVSHTPPVNTQCDRISSGSHVGSLAVRGFIEKYKPLACFTGHIHEAKAIDRIGDTWVVNPGNFSRNRYAWAEILNNEINVEIRNF